MVPQARLPCLRLFSCLPHQASYLELELGTAQPQLVLCLVIYLSSKRNMTTTNQDGSQRRTRTLCFLINFD
jgi:hypothetical protein